MGQYPDFDTGSRQHRSFGNVKTTTQSRLRIDHTACISWHFSQCQGITTRTFCTDYYSWGACLMNTSVEKLVDLVQSKCDQNTVVRSTREAIEAGYRHIDTAQIYDTEAGVGQAVREKIQERKVKRDEIFITTKLWNHAHSRKDVVPALKKSLQTMGLDYVDLFLIHWPVALKANIDVLLPRDDKGDLIFADDEIDFTETWQGMEDAVESGLTRAIGISNFNEKQIERILQRCKVKPMNLQLESNPYFNNNKLIKFCQSHGITVTGFSPLGLPSRTWQNNLDDPYVATDKVLLSIADKYGKSPQQIALKFQVQRGVAVIPKSNTPSRIRENILLFDFTLTEKEMKQVEALDRNFRILWLPFLKPSKEYPYKG